MASSTPVVPRPWKPTTAGELKVWIGLLLVMGVNRWPAMTDYWSEYWRSPPMSAMSLNRFQQIKRYLHVSPPVKPKNHEWWHKLEPMSSIAQRRCRECYLPSSDVAIDEMMVKCEGRSAHTLMMKNKPIDQGYKLFALADHGYTYTWVYHSRKDGSALASAAYESNDSEEVSPKRHLCATSRTCLHLALSLPYKMHQFNIYFDNYFTNISLYATLREYGIGACGTTRTNTVPEELRVDKALAKKELEWNDLFGAVEDTVLCGLWQDSAQVLVMSTIHDLQTGTTKLRRRPKENQLNSKITRAVFGPEVISLAILAG